MDTSTVGFNGYLPNGMKVFYQFPILDLEAMTLIAANYDNLFELTNILLAKGLSLHEPSVGVLEAGEKADSVGYVLRYDKVNKSGNLAPVIGLYPANDGAVKKYLWVYLDEPEQVKAFEDATGVKVANMKPWLTNQAPDRSDAMAEYFTKVRDGVNVIYKDNPEWTPDPKDKFTPKRLFVRWPTPTPQPPSSAASAPVAGSVEIPTHVIDDEAELRRKAATALDNEYITIFKVRYEQTRGGVGVERWIATANVEGGGTVPVTVYGEDANRITKAGYTWPKTDGDNLAIPVITELRGSDRRITHVEPLETAQDAAAWVLDKPTLLTTLANDPRTRAINYKERNATVEKMIVENAYNKVATLGGAIEMTVMRLQSHHAERKSA